MEKIKLNNNQTFEIITCGVSATPEKLTLFVLPGDLNLSAIEESFSSDNTQNIYLLSSENDEELRLYKGYTRLSRIEKRKDTEIGTSIAESGEELSVIGELAIIELEKPDETSERITALEETVDTLTLEILGV